MSASGKSSIARKLAALVAIALFSGLSEPASAGDAPGLDLTMQVLGKDDKFDDRLANRIRVPGIGAGISAERAKAAAAAAKDRQDARQDNRDDRRERRDEAVERYRDRRGR